LAVATFVWVAITSCGGSDAPTGPVDSIEPALISVSPDAIGLDALGATTRATVRVLDETGNPLPDPVVAWSSTDPSIVSVDPYGVVTAVRPGSAQISVSVDDLVAYVSASVVQVPSSITLHSTEGTLGGPGDTLRVVAVVQDRLGATVAGATLAWSVADPTVATVDRDGRLTGVSTGATSVVVASGPATATFTVTVTSVPASVAVDPDSVRFPSLGATETLTATVRDSRGDEIGNGAVQWRSADPAVADVSDGLVRAVGNGATWIEASAGPIRDSVRIVVDQVPASVSTLPSTLTLMGPGDTLRATASVLDAGGSTIQGASISWTAGNTAVATVDAGGLVTGVAAGETSVRATHDELTASLDVVVAAPVEVPSFASDINPLFRSNGCLSCHGGGGAGGLVLSRDAATSYANLVDIPSQGAPDYLRVERYDSFDSYLIMKLEGRQLSGGSMPLAGTPLSGADLSKIKRWIDGGAPNNQ
jgi:uncharacterized protein YjdB